MPYVYFYTNKLKVILNICTYIIGRLIDIIYAHDQNFQNLSFTHTMSKKDIYSELIMQSINVLAIYHNTTAKNHLVVCFSEACF